MTYKEFMSWFAKHTPEGCDEDDFLDFLAMLGATVLESASGNTGKSVDDLINFVFTEGGNLSQ